MYIITQAPAAAVATLSVTAAGTTTFVVAAGEPGAGAQQNLSAPGTNRLNGKPFAVRASGYLSAYGTATLATSAATPLQIVLFGANTASFAVGANALASLTAVAAYTQAAATVTAAAPLIMPWNIEVQFLGGPSGSLQAFNQGGFMANANGVNLVTIPAATTATIASFNPVSEPSVQFAVAVVVAGSANLGGLNFLSTISSFVLEA